MKRSAPAAATEPEFSRPVELARLAPDAPHDFDETATEAERAAIARLLGAISLPKFAFRGRLAPSGREWILEGTLGYTVVQPCVATLAPVKTRIDVPVRRRYVPGGPDIDDEEADDEIEPLTPVIDLGAVATEEAALALPAYPRASGAEPVEASFGPPGATPAPAGTERPFAALAGLRDRLKRDG